MMNHIRTSFDDIESRIFVMIFHIIDFIEFNKKLFDILFKLRIKMYALTVSRITIFFKIFKVVHVRVMLIDVDNNFHNIYFYNRYIMSIIFF